MVQLGTGVQGGAESGDWSRASGWEIDRDGWREWQAMEKLIIINAGTRENKVWERETWEVSSSHSSTLTSTLLRTPYQFWVGPTFLLNQHNYLWDGFHNVLETFLWDCCPCCHDCIPSFLQIGKLLVHAANFLFYQDIILDSHLATGRPVK